MLITLEGAPAVGKSTTANCLHWPVVPEVNKLFGKKMEGQGGQDWYLQRQLDRWQLARRAEAQHGFAVLDGDVFQPLWFTALFPHEPWGELDATARFFGKAVEDGRVAMPHHFVILTLTEKERSHRELSRCAAAGRSIDQASRKVARYADFAAFQCALYDAVGKAFGGLVSFVDTSERPEVTAGRLRDFPCGTPPPASAVLDVMVAWCREHRSKCLGADGALPTAEVARRGGLVAGVNPLSNKALLRAVDDDA